MILTMPFSNRAFSLPRPFCSGGQMEKLYIAPGGLGDSVLFTAVAENYFRLKSSRMLVSVRFPEFFKNNPTAIWMLPDLRPSLPNNRELEPLLKKRGLRPVAVKYFDFSFRQDGRLALTFPDCHLLARLCQRVGLSGKISLAPRLYLSKREKSGGAFFPRQVAIHSAGKTPFKNWGHRNMQKVVDALQKDIHFVQIGLSADPLLENTLDMRGKLTLRQTAAVLHHSLAFCGMLGGLMHMARAVDCRAVIAFPASEPPHFSAYSCNYNIMPESGCNLCALNQRSVFSKDPCPHKYSCARNISSERVIEALRELLREGKAPLRADEVVIAAEPSENCQDIYKWKAVQDAY